MKFEPGTKVKIKPLSKEEYKKLAGFDPKEQVVDDSKPLTIIEKRSSSWKNDCSLDNDITYYVDNFDFSSSYKGRKNTGSIPEGLLTKFIEIEIRI